MRVTLTVQLVMIGWSACSLTAGLCSIQNKIQGYVFYNNRRVMFKVIASREQGYDQHVRRTVYDVGDGVVA